MNNEIFCDCCCERILDSDIGYSDDYFTICSYCCENEYTRCESCGNLVHNNNISYQNDCSYCNDCYNELPALHDYNYKPYFEFYGDSNHENLLTFGVELEVDYGCEDDISSSVQELTETRLPIYCKSDGSLDCGFEIVTHPATLDYHCDHMDWSTICGIATGYGFKSHDTNTCGLHVHVGRIGLGENRLEQDIVIAKTMLLMDKWYDDFIIPFSRRKKKELAEWSAKNDANILEGDSIDEVVTKSKYAGCSRYKALNLTNRSTIEFRFFKGTLNHNTILASIQWIDTLIKYCQSVELVNLFHTSWYDLFGKTEYKELANYLDIKKLRNEVK